MPQSLVLANGNMCVSFDKKLQMRDFHFPFVGEENQSEFGEYHRIGICIDGNFSWLGEDDQWKYHIQYSENSLVGDSTASHDGLQVSLHFEDLVYTTSNILCRNVTIQNLAEYEREIKIFFHHDFHIYGDKKQETAEFDPELHGILHYRQARYFFVGGRWEDEKKSKIDFTTGKSDYQGHEGTFRDAEDGKLSKHPIEQGSVDSTIGFIKKIPAQRSKKIFFWCIAGRKYCDITKGYKRIEQMTPQNIAHHTRDYWKQWSEKCDLSCADLSKEVKKIFYQSILLVRTQIDNRGAIIAATDSDIMKFNKDTYSYMWPRDGSLVSMAMSRLGYTKITERFLEFCEKIITEEGYVLHKFTPSGNLGSSWHPKWKDGKSQLPIQEDESALILVALEEFYTSSKQLEVVQRFFNSMVLTIGRFLVRFVDKKTGLPKPTYDLWEEQMGIFSYTSSTVYAGLKAAENLSHLTGHYADAKIFGRAAKKMQKAIVKYLFCEEHKRFLKKTIPLEDGTLSNDHTIDASMAFVWEMGVLQADDPKVISTMQAIEQQLTVQTDVGGICRYTGDFYQRNWEREYSENIPGNPWIITTLWLANWYIEIAKTKKDLEKPKEILQWAAEKANDACILPEQIDPFTNEPLSVAPLTWSHATFIDTVRRYTEKSLSLQE